jgi:hypothetical protein
VVNSHNFEACRTDVIHAARTVSAVLGYRERPESGY